MLIEKPSIQITPSAPARDTGIDRAGTMVARHEPMKTNNVNTTRMMVMLKEPITSPTESRMNSASSLVTTMSISTKRLFRSSTMAITSSEISMVLELACLITPKPITGRPSRRTILLLSAGPKNTLATSPTRISPLITISETSCAETDVASARTIRD